ncbi:ATP-binding protein [Saccharibacillus sp. JS10]|uniref:ATP-binding protein n=1 Tax=Saccharibacillus sp. JS10 TaxID=2950552 RepID=UPI00210D652C|nr:ATP-binding protein [Saccharibacillus sp. JS10]MCQ4087628.1 ATP-binding protein [Saccharibacillus sp. JS10]
MTGSNRNFFGDFTEAAAHVVKLLSQRLPADSVIVVSNEGPVSTVIKAFNRKEKIAEAGQVFHFDPKYFAEWVELHWQKPIIIPQMSKHPLTQKLCQSPRGAHTPIERGMIGFPISYPDGKRFGGLIALGAEHIFSDADLELLTSMALFLSYIIELERRNEIDNQHLGKLVEDKQVVEGLAETYRGEAQAAKQSTQQKAEFLAFMTHEIRNSLNGSVAMSELLAMTKLTPDQQQYLNMIRSSNDFLLTLANNILDFSKLEAGKHNIEVSLFDPISTIEDVAVLVAPRAIEKHVELILDIEEGLPLFLEGDAGKLRQILLNLLGNAVKFTHQGQILLSICEGSCNEVGMIQLEIKVQDTGIGIAEHQMEGLFQTYHQVYEPSEPSSRYGGTGLGLAITQHLVELMGGQISLTSKLGVGTEFVVNLPFSLYTEFDIAPPVLPRLEELRILIVDDNQTALHVLERLLSGWGVISVGVHTASEAFEKLQQEVFDLVLLDLHVIDLARQIAKLPEAPSIGLLAPLGTVPDLEGLARVCFTVFKPLRRFQLYSALSAIK